MFIHSPLASSLVHLLSTRVIMGFAIKEDRPTPPEVYNAKVYFYTFCASMGAVMFGYDTGVIGGTLALPGFKRAFGLTDKSASDLAGISANIVSAFQAGCFFGALAMFPISEKIGRRYALMISAVIFIVGSFMQTFANSVGLITAGRAIGGLGVGSASLIVPPFIAEISPPAIRGRLVGMYEVFLQMGAVVGFWINYGMTIHIPASSDKQWQIPLGIQIIPGGMLLLGMFFMPESPRWLMKKGRHDRAGEILSHVRNLPVDHEYIQYELQDMQAQIDRERHAVGGASFTAKLKELLTKGVRNRLAIGMAMMMCQNLTGINAINYYSPTIFKSLGFQGTSAGLFATGIYGVVKCVATLVFMIWFIDVVGRRRALIYGSIGASLCMLYIGSYLKVANPSPTAPTSSPGGWAAVVALYLFAVSFCMSWNGIAWIYCSEIFPVNIRMLCLAITTATQWIWQFVIARSTPYMIENIKYGTYLFFGACTVAMGLWVYFLVPETKGVTLEGMDALFGVPGAAERDAARHAETHVVTDEKDSTSSISKEHVTHVESV